MKGYPSGPRVVVLVASGALLQAVFAPQLSFGWVAPNFLVLALVAAVPGLRELESVLLGFFGGILTDALGAGLFGAGAFGGAVVGMVLTRTGRRGPGVDVTRIYLAGVAALAVAVYGGIRLLFLALGEGMVPFGGFMVVGFLADVLANGVLSFLICRPLMRLTRTRGEG